MTKMKLLAAGLLATAMFSTPAIAGVTQEPGVMGFNYPNTNYLTGSNGVRATPRAGYYYRRYAYAPRYYGGYGPDYYYGPAGLPGALIGGAIATGAAIATAPFGGPDYYYGPY